MIPLQKGQEWIRRSHTMNLSCDIELFSERKTQRLLQVSCHQRVNGIEAIDRKIDIIDMCMKLKSTGAIRRMIVTPLLFYSVDLWWLKWTTKCSGGLKLIYVVICCNMFYVLLPTCTGYLQWNLNSEWRIINTADHCTPFLSLLRSWYEVSWLRVVFVTSCPGLSWVRVV